MTIIEAINRLDSLMHNTFNKSDKVAWLSRVDAMVKRLIIDTHEGGENVTFTEYTDKTPTDTVLLIPAPFDEVYLRWLEAQIHYANGEYGKYNNAILMYNTAFSAYQDFYNRSHMPKNTDKRFLF